EPFALTFHCWLAPPLQSQIWTFAPGLVLPPLTSRHLLPYTVSVLAGVDVHDWLRPPLQSQISTGAPLAVDWPVTSRQRLEPTPRMFDVLPPMPQAHCSRLTPLALVFDNVPLPLRVSMLYVSPVRSPG